MTMKRRNCGKWERVETAPNEAEVPVILDKLFQLDLLVSRVLFGLVQGRALATGSERLRGLARVGTVDRGSRFGRSLGGCSGHWGCREICSGSWRARETRVSLIKLSRPSRHCAALDTKGTERTHRAWLSMCRDMCGVVPDDFRGEGQKRSGPTDKCSSSVDFYLLRPHTQAPYRLSARQFDRHDLSRNCAAVLARNRAPLVILCVAFLVLRGAVQTLADP